MATKSIAWTSGSGNITLTYSGQGDDTVVVTSDPNTLAVPRSQTITFSTTVGSPSVTQQVTVTQLANAGLYTGYPTSWDNTEYMYDSISDVENGYSYSNSGTYATIYLTKGNQVWTYIYYLFDLSSIPANATIKSVSCKAKARVSTTNTSYIRFSRIILYAGSNEKGTATNITTTATELTLDTGSWTRAELNSLRLRVYARRGSSSVNTSRYIQFYGATLTIEYE